jgi:hypothetical protein
MGLAIVDHQGAGEQQSVGAGRVASARHPAWGLPEQARTVHEILGSATCKRGKIVLRVSAAE